MIFPAEDIFIFVTCRRGYHAGLWAQWNTLEYQARNREGEYVVCTCHGRVSQDKESGIPLFVGTTENHGILDWVDATTNLYNIYEFSKCMKEFKTEGKK